MRISQILESTTAGSIAPVAKPMGEAQKRPAIRGLSPVENIMTGKAKKKGPYANSLSEGKVKQISMDLQAGSDGLSDAEFKKKYGKSKAEMRKSMQDKPANKEPSQVDEAELHEEDKIIAPGKGTRSKPGLMSKDKKGALSKYLAPFKGSGLWVTDKRGNSVLECTEHGMAAEVAKALNAYVIANEAITTGGVIAGGGVGEGVSEGAAPWASNWKKAALASKKAQQAPSGANHKRAAELHRQGAKDPWGPYRDNHIEAAEKHEKAMKMYEGAKVDRMVKHVAQSEKKLGHSKKEAENIAWATANKRGMLDNKNKKK